MDPGCQCNNTCSRVGKRGACPCRTAGIACTDFCRCGHLMPCINRDEREEYSDASSNDFEPVFVPPTPRQNRKRQNDAPDSSSSSKKSKIPLPSLPSLPSLPACRGNLLSMLPVPEPPKQSRIPKLKPTAKQTPKTTTKTTTKKTAKATAKPTSQPVPQPPTLGQQRECQVQDYLDKLSEERAKDILKEMMLRDNQVFMDHIFASQERPPSPEPPSSEVPPGCLCGNCRKMASNKEDVCCTNKRTTGCITSQPTFQAVVLDEAVLDAAGAYHNDLFVHEHHRNNRMFRHTAYKQFTLMEHGILRKGQRKVVPSCCVLAIRRKYPSITGRYTGFLNAR